MFTFISSSFRTRGGVAVTAFQLATGTSASSRSAHTASMSFGTMINRGKCNTVRPAAFHRTPGTQVTSNLKLQMSTVTLSADQEKKVNVEHPAYEIIEKDFIEEYGAATTLYRHKKSGAELLSVSTDDDNKVFGITFRTPRKDLSLTFCMTSSLFVTSSDLTHHFISLFLNTAEDSTGVPHILEHSVLCGSRKYTTKDPFVQLLQG